MKQWKRVLSKIPRRLRQQYGFKTHMQERPSGMPRAEWAGVWAAQHAVKWPVGDRVALGARVLPHCNYPPKVSPRVAYRIGKGQKTAVSDADFLQTYEWRQLRMVVLTKRGARCECCGASPKDGVTVINVDHIKPRRLFPALALVESNLQILCAPCNHGKGNWNQTDWRDPATVASPRLVQKPKPTDIDMTDEQACRIWNTWMRSDTA